MTFSEIHAWSEMAGVKPLPREVDLLMALDRIRWRVANGWERDRMKGKRSKPGKRGRP